jgi:hypothetical protein
VNYVLKAIFIATWPFIMIFKFVGRMLRSYFGEFFNLKREDGLAGDGGLDI